MKNLFFILIALSVCVNSIGQTKYTTKNKKAIKLFEAGMKEPGLSIDPVLNMPNYRGGLELMKQAIAKDSNFLEAHLVAGEFAENIYEYETAVIHYKRVLAINPRHSATGSTYFYLANMEQATGKYDDAIRNIDLFLKFPMANDQLVKSAHEIRANCEFSKSAMNRPVDFKPINVGPGINTEHPEYFPTITVDGKTILFTREIPDNRVSTKKKAQEDFYVSTLQTNNIWGKAVAMPSNINTVQNEGAPTLAPDGRGLVFVACPDVTGKNYGRDRTGRGSCDLFYTKKLGSRWTDPVNIPGYINSYHWETQPSLSADGKTLYFIRGIRGANANGNSDIYVSHLDENGIWGKAERLPNHINTMSAEESVLIHPDGKTLYFASRGHIGMGGSDLYVTRMDENGNWSNPQNLGYPINTRFDENSLMVSADGEIAFFASDRTGGFGGLDIYFFNMPEHLKPTKTLYFEGLVYDIETRDPVAGKFTLKDLETGEEVIISTADKVTGEFMVSLPIDRRYALSVEYPGYTFFSQSFDMKNPLNLEAIHMDVPMVPLTSPKPTTLKNVFFDLAKSNLRKESFIELDKLVQFLNDNPNLNIEIGGHTDTRGDDLENLELSKARAKSVHDYIVSKGIKSERMSHKGYGENQTVHSDEEIAGMTTDKDKEAAHQANRRTEYKIVSE
jgi:outer membrane protein OmpA-like peptidoglycan-associated protein/Tol biopolymer transport system component